MEKLKILFKWIWNLPRFLVCSFIKLYQKTLSFDHGPLKKYFPYGYCKYKPTCSDYCHEVVKDMGIIKGGAKCIYRVVRCNPCSKGGYDPVKK